MPMNENALAALPSHCVRPLAPFLPQQLQRWAEDSGQRFVDIDLEGAPDRGAVLRAIGLALGFPPWYGANLDALYDCLTDLVEREPTAWLIVLRSLSASGALDAEARAALLDVFEDAIEAFADAGVGLRVFHAP